MAQAKAQWHESKRSRKERVLLYILRYGPAFLIGLPPCILLVPLVHANLLKPVGLSEFIAGASVLLAVVWLHEMFVARCPNSVLLGEIRLPRPDEPIDSFPVRLVVRWGGLELGRDDGVVSFSEGKLRFDGERTNFAVGRRSVFGVFTWGKALRDGRIVYLSEPQSRLQLQIKLPTSWELRGRIRRELDRQIGEWDRVAAPTEDETLPPLTADPGFAQRERALANTSFIGGCLASGLGILWPVLGGVLALNFFFSFFRHAETYLALRKLLRRSASQTATRV